VRRLVYVLRRTLETGQEQDEFYFLCHLVSWDGTQTGPEFREGNGDYMLELLPISVPRLCALTIKPEVVKNFLVEHADQLETLPDLRC
jgi:hypothetical protein